jgi:hypothetical protein
MGDIKDGATEIILDYNDWKMHDKQMHGFSMIFTNTADSATAVALINTPSASTVYISFDVENMGNAEVEILKSAVVSTTGSDQISALNMFDGGPTCGSAFYKNPTALTGTSWKRLFVPGTKYGNTFEGKVTSFPVGPAAKFGLLANSSYGIRITNLVGSTATIGLSAQFFERG